jgi:hypothetical protein
MRDISFNTAHAWELQDALNECKPRKHRLPVLLETMRSMD